MSNEYYQHHKEDVDKHGFNKAVILCIIRAKVYEYQVKGVNYHFGWNWFYISAKRLNELFPFMSVDIVGRMLRELEKDEIINSKILARRKTNRVKYYTIVQHLDNYNPVFNKEKVNLFKSDIIEEGIRQKFYREKHQEEKRVADIINNTDWMEEFPFPF
jgi:hypothetical protein